MTYKNINIKRRMFIMLCVFFAMFVVLVYRLFYWQVIRYDDIQKKIGNQSTRDTPIKAKRGDIVDRNGVTLSTSGTSYQVSVIPGAIDKNAREKIATELSQILELDYEEILKKTAREESQVTIKRQVEYEIFEKLRSKSLVGVSFSPDTKRYYPMRSLAAQLIGYTSGDGEGQEGIEAKYNKQLAGIDGKTLQQKGGDSKPVPFGASFSKREEQGNDVTLTIDAQIQSIVDSQSQEAFEVNNAGSVQTIVMNPKTGEIYAMTTKQDFDLNAPPRSDGALRVALSRNKPISDSYEPGSTFKILTLASGLESGVVTPESQFDCIGYKIVDGQKIKCWRTIPHGHETLAQGVENSCNPVFMEIALRQGTDDFYKYLDDFGLNAKTDIGLSGEASGIVKPKKLVKQFDLARIGFGQTISVTPLQLVSAVSAVINGGNLMKPYVVDKITSIDGAIIEQNKPTVVRRVVSEKTSKIVNEMLEGVVANGSGRNAYIPGYRVGGKTGTAQKYENGKIAQGKYVASFIGFAPSDDPQVLVLMLVDEPKISSQVFGSTVAAPFVRTILHQTLRRLNVLPKYGDEESENVEIIVPDVKNTLVAEGTAQLRSLGLNSLADGAGLIVNQAPQAGTKVPKSTGILLYTTIPEKDSIEREVDLVAVPNVTGRTLDTAYEILSKEGIEAQATGNTNGVVVSQFPYAGELIEQGTVVVLTLQ